MQHKSLEARLKDFEHKAKLLADSKYTCQRDTKGNLILTFVNGKRLKIPVVRLRSYQEEAQIKLFIEKFKRLFFVWPRRAGKEVQSWNMIVEGAIESSGLYLMIYPTNVRAKIVLWDGAITLPDGSSLKFLDMIPKELILSINRQEMSVTLINQSIIRVIGSDIDPDKLRGVNVRGAVFSEYAFSDPRVLHILMPVFRQNNGWFILQTTFNGMNHAYRLMQEIKTNPDWYSRIESIETLVDEKGNRYITDEMIDEDRRSGMPEYLIQQEYYSIVQLNEETLYFARQINTLYEREMITPNLVLPGKRVRLHFDIGWDDATAMLLEQMDQNGNPVIIAYHEANNKLFEYFIQWAEMFCQKHGVFVDKTIYLPHDGANKNPAQGKSYADYALEMGYHSLIMPKPSTHIMAIQAMRKQLYSVRINREPCQRLIDCLSNYQKEFDTKSGTYEAKPKHDWSSHGVKAYQTMTFAYFGHHINENSYEVVYIKN